MELFKDYLDSLELDEIQTDEVGKHNTEAEQLTLQWFIERATRFTASGMMKLMANGNKFGVGQVSYVESILASRMMTEEGLKTHCEEQMKKEFRQTKWGNFYESMAADALAAEIGEKLFETGFKQNELMPYFGGSIDRRTAAGTPVELKCPYDPAKHIKNYNLCLIEMTPKHEYYPQFQAHMLNEGTDMCIFGSFDPRMKDEYKIAHIECERDDAYIDLMQRKISKAEEAINIFFEEGIPVPQTLLNLKV